MTSDRREIERRFYYFEMLRRNDVVALSTYAQACSHDVRWGLLNGVEIGDATSAEQIQFFCLEIKYLIGLT